MGWTKVLNAGDAATELTGTAYRLLIVDSSGDVTELVHGTNGQVLTSGGASADPTWETPSAGAHALDAGQTDVTITTPADNEVLAYDNGSSEWINQTAAEAGLLADSAGSVDGTNIANDAVGAAHIDETDTGIAVAQLCFTPAASGTGTVEGTVFYDSDDNHLYVYVA
jgi:hypothetical protein